MIVVNVIFSVLNRYIFDTMGATQSFMVVKWQAAQSEVHLLQRRLASTEQRLLGEEQCRKVAEERPAICLECILI